MPKTKRRMTVVLGAALALVCGLPALAAGGSRIEEIAPVEAELTPEQQADRHYNEGLAQRDEAWRLEKKLVQAPAEKRDKIEQKISQAHERSVTEFTSALASNPRHYQALAGLGYAFRQLGDYAKALAAYDAALEISPGYGPALEYRGEAYLAMNRINDAQNAYRVLLEHDPRLAPELLGAMQSWIEARRAVPAAGVESAQIDGLESWVKDRDRAAAESSLHKTRTW